MAKNSRTPATMIFPDHEVIRVPNNLAKAVSRVAFTAPDEDPVARAEQALEKLSSEFASWMIAECDRLDKARQSVHQLGFTKATRDELFHSAHDIKGDAATLGYPAVAPSAESLCRILELTTDISTIPLQLIDQHVDAIRAIVREYARPDCEQIASTLTQRLRKVTDAFLGVAADETSQTIAEASAPGIVPGKRD